MKARFVVLFILISFLFSCKKDNVTSLRGFVQKGPFINGSTVTISELSSGLSPTGKNYTIQITDNRGTFEIQNISLVSEYVNLRADGFYFNEVIGKKSAAQITLHCITDLSDKTNINVNLLSHLEKQRVEFLKGQGISFSNAKKQAQQEILSIFKISKDNIPDSELLDITKSGDNNAILLAVSLILQGFRSEAELTELLAAISNDIRTDGVLSNIALGSALINDAKYLKLDEIRQHISARWNYLGISNGIPDFETHVNNFIENSDYPFTNFITYPATDTYGINVLNNTDRVFVEGSLLSLSAMLPSGTNLIIKHNGNYGELGYMGGSLDGWDDLGTDSTYQWRSFASNRTGHIKMKVVFTGNCTIYFYENDSTTPTRVKNLYKQ